LGALHFFSSLILVLLHGTRRQAAVQINQTEAGV
jgi:hypothetical protein